jgi:Fe-S cluster biogenesis protein NfuA
MFIQTEATPNPATIKFIPGETVLEKGTAEFRNLSEAQGKSPLAERLFKITGIQGVFLGSDFISITKDDKKEWLMLKPLILGALFEHLSTKQPILLEGASTDSVSSAIHEEDSDTVRMIKELLESRIRPAVAQDGGDIEFDHFERGILFLRMRGACSGCPSSTITLKTGIENMMRHYVPEVLEVRAVAD